MFGEPNISLSLVKELIEKQFPQWAHLPVRPVSASGWDNRTFHLGDDMSIRLPSAERYTQQAHIEQKWLPKLAPCLSYPIPEPLAMGKPSKNYPWNWSIYRWIDGDTADVLCEEDLQKFAIDSAKFLNELQKINTTGGPLAGPHNFYRGASLSVYDEETRVVLS